MNLQQAIERATAACGIAATSFEHLNAPDAAAPYYAARDVLEKHANLLETADALLRALDACLPDLRHYASTHGPGPDVRLAALERAVRNAKGIP
jgi:hypothetical protein